MCEKNVQKNAKLFAFFQNAKSARVKFVCAAGKKNAKKNAKYVLCPRSVSPRNDLLNALYEPVRSDESGDEGGAAKAMDAAPKVMTAGALGPHSDDATSARPKRSAKASRKLLEGVGDRALTCCDVVIGRASCRERV